MLFTGERQVAPLISGIRKDHVERYKFAAGWLKEHKLSKCRVLDCACGIGYGSHILAESGFNVIGVDVSLETIQYAKMHWCHDRVSYVVLDAYDLNKLDNQFDAIVSFESVEHFECPEPVIKQFSSKANVLIFSVPNEAVIPFGPGFAHHYRHYRSNELVKLIKPYRLIDIRGQLDKTSPVSNYVEGRTLVGVGKIF